MIFGFRAPTGAPRFESAFVHRLRIAVAATILRAWQREGFAFVTLAQAWFGRAEVVRGVARKPGTLVARPVKRCGRKGCGLPRLAAPHGTGILCAEHEREVSRFSFEGQPPGSGIVIERATWPIDSEEVREIVAMTLALGARYAETADPFELGVNFEARIRELRAQFDGVEAARAEVV